MPVSRLGACALALLLAGCGSGTDPAGAGGSGGETRTVTHSAGTTEVPQDPRRVVALGDPHVAALAALGVPLVGIGDQDAFVASSYAELLPEGTDLASVDTIGDPYDPNLEAVAALEPDLILGDEFLEVYDQLSAIAPTVLVSYGANGGWRTRFREIAAAVGREDRAAEVERAYEQELAALDDTAREQTVAFVRVTPEGGFRVDSLPTAFPGSVAVDAGVPTLRPEGVGAFDEESGFLELSAENLDVLAGADRIVLGDNSAYDPTLDDSLSVLQRNPLWAALPAVRAGRVSQVPGPVYNGGNHFSARLLLRELARPTGRA
jgi:iron complex transport system substrate-binding protein